MILLPSSRQRVARVPLLFRATDCQDESGLFALSFGKRLAASFARAGVATLRDGGGRLVRAASGMPRVGYLPVVGGGSLLALLLEAASTNLIVRSEELSDAAWIKVTGVTVTANSLRAPDGTMTGDLVTTDGSAGSLAAHIIVGFTADGVKVVSVHLQQGTAAEVDLNLHDVTAAVNRHIVNVAWGAGGVPTVTTQGGAGTRFEPEPLAHGWWRIAFGVDGVIATPNENRLFLYPAGIAAVAGNVGVWGAQAENDPVPSSYRATGAATVSRVADDLYFALPYLVGALGPFTAYFDAVEQHHPALGASVNRAALLIGDSTGTAEARAYIYHGFGSGGYRAGYDPAGAPQSDSGILGTGVTRGTRVEHRLHVTAAGIARYGLAVAGGAETLASDGSAAAPSAWAGNRVYLNGFGVGNRGAVGVRALVIASGERSLAELRELAETG